MRLKILAGWFWILSVHLVHGQTNIVPVPDQTIGRGGDFEAIDLHDFALEDVVWEVGFLLPEDPGSPPEWQVSSSDYQFEMNVTAVVKSKGQLASGDSHLLAVRDGEGLLRGVASALQVQDSWVYFLTVYGNTSGTELHFMFYDAQYGEVLNGTTVDFVPNGVVGQPDDPLQLTAEVMGLELVGSVLNITMSDAEFLGTEHVLLKAHAVDNPGHVDLDTLQLSVIDDYEPEINGIPDQTIAFGGVFETIDLSAYVALQDADEVVYSGSSGELTVEIVGSMATIGYPEGWSGTGTVVFRVTDVSDLGFSDTDEVDFHVLPAEQAPVVAGIPDQRLGIGSEPGDIDLGQYLSTNNPSGIVWSVAPYSVSTDPVPSWQVNPAGFEFNMSATCSVSSFGQPGQGNDNVLGVFSQSDSTLLGHTSALQVEGDWYYFLTIYSNSGEEQLFFRYYDSDLQRVLSIPETLTFTPNAVIGDPLEPVILTAGPIKPTIAAGVASFELIDQSWSGVESFVFQATDTTTQDHLSDTDTMEIEVIDVSAPTLSQIPAQIIDEGTGFSDIDLATYLGGVDLDQVEFAVSGADTLNVSLNEGVVSFTVPGEDYFGSSTLTVSATHLDFPELSAVRQVSLVVNNINDAPTIPDSPVTDAVVGELYQFEINGHDIDDSDLGLNVLSKPDWLVFVANGGFGLLFGTPAAKDEGATTVSIELSDGEAVALLEFELTVINSYARLINPPIIVVKEGEGFEAYDLTTITEKTDDYTVTYSVAGGESLEASINGTELTVTVPDADWYGRESFTIGLINADNEEILDEVTITYEVTNINDAPIILSTADSTAQVAEAYQYEIVAEDIDSEDLEVSVEHLPDWLTLSKSNGFGVLYGIPTALDTGVYELVITVSDGELTAEQTFELSVGYSYARLLEPEVQQTNEGEAFEAFDLNTITEKSDDFTVSYTISDSDVLNAVVAGSQLLVTVPDLDWYGSEVLTLGLINTENDSLMAEMAITYEVTNVNDAPTFISTPVNFAQVGEVYQYEIVTEDIDSEDLEVSVEHLPDWLTLSKSNGFGVLYGIPTALDTGVYELIITVSDGALTAEQSYELSVSYSFARLLTIPDQSIAEGSGFDPLDLSEFIEQSEDLGVVLKVEGGDLLSFVLVDNTLSVTVPNADWYGSDICLVKLLSADDGSLFDSQELSYVVTNVNDAPTFISTPVNFSQVGEAYQYEIVAEDIDSEDLEVSVEHLPDWLTMSKSNGFGVLYGIPTALDTGVYELIITVSDGALTAEQSYELSVSYSFARLLTIPDQSIAEGSGFDPLDLSEFIEQSEDLDVVLEVEGGDLLSFALVDNTLSVTVPNADWYGSDICLVKLLSADDGSLFDSQELSYVVTNVNDAPTFISTPVNFAQVDELYQYEIFTEDIDSDHLVMSAENLPGWLSFSQGNGFGVLFGTPSEDDAGEHPVELAVSDGELSERLEFVVAVSASYARLSDIPNQVIDEGAQFPILNLNEYLEITDDLEVTFSISGGIELDFIIEEGLLSVAIPDEDWFGQETVEIGLVDGDGNVHYVDNVSYEVRPVNDAPVFLTEPVVRASPEIAYVYQFEVTDVDNALINVSVGALPDWLKLVQGAEGFSLEGIPQLQDTGSFQLDIRATDGELETVQSFVLVVSGNYAQFLDIPTQEIAEGEEFFDLDLNDYLQKSEDLEVYFQVSERSGELTFGLDGSLLSAEVPHIDWYGSAFVVVDMLGVDGDANYGSKQINYNVSNVNDAPEITSVPLGKASVGNEYRYVVEAVDVDSEELVFGALDLPAWLTLEGSVLSGTPTATDVGSIALTVTVSDGSFQADQQFTVEVSNSYARWQSVPLAHTEEGGNFDPIDLNGLIDKSEDVMVYVTVDSASHISFQLNELMLVPSINDEDWFGLDSAMLSIYDHTDSLLYDQVQLRLEVTNVNDAPQIVSTPLSLVDIDAAYAYMVVAEDIDNEQLAFSADGLPAWLSLETLDGKSAVLKGTPQVSDAGLVLLEVVVSDGELTDVQLFELSVGNEYAQFRDVPTQTINEGEGFDTLEIANYVAKTNGITVAYEVSGEGSLVPKVIGDSRLAVQIPDQEWNGVELIVLRMLDAESGSLYDSVSIVYEVLAVNDVPLIDAVELPEAFANELYNAEISISDEDSPSLNYHLVEKPEWLRYAATEVGVLLFGTPAESDAGDFVVELAVSDGDTVVAGTFDLRVVVPEVLPSSIPTVQLFPNPVSRYLYVSGLQDEGDIVIRDINGHEVLRSHYDGSEWTIDLKLLSSAIYLIEILPDRGKSKTPMTRIIKVN